MYRIENENLIINDNVINDFETQKTFTKNNFRNRTAQSFLLVIDNENVYKVNNLTDVLVPGDRSDIYHSKAWDIFRIEKQYTGQMIFVKLFRNSPRGEAAFKVFSEFLNVEIKENKDE